ncbi:hemagglutinin-neuraminidase [Tuhoko virus 2]|uniref:Hemagglutinin-neuraminidase n=1 Tax=Tuhoko virus 2 TaxID=798073 RepID=D8WJ34_9MONO|nr:hemagglutinin-neuraminidase [Tuhoko virus 2]ADI80721.1 hemagglutinin-neuraminidase [Tuhoko virus 2]
MPPVPTVSQSIDEGSFTDIPLSPDDIKHPLSKKTCRKLFRIVTLIGVGLISILTIISLAQQTGILRKVDSSDFQSYVQESFKQVLNLMKQFSSNLNSLIEITSVTLPFRIDQFGTDIKTQVAQLVRQCNAVCRGPIKGPTTQNIVYPALYETSLNKTLETKNVRIQEVRQEVDPVPGPGLSNGCTRNPSFSVYHGVWCYTHATSIGNCNGSLGTSQLFRIGNVLEGDGGAPYHKSLATHLLTTRNVSRQCSATASYYGCYFICSEPVLTERDDYETPGIEPITIFRLDPDGNWVVFPNINRFTEYSLKALYPGIGSGVLFQGKLIFPMYGGIDKERLSALGLGNIGLIERRMADTCNHTEKELGRSFPGAFSSPYYHDAVMLNFLLICEMIENLPGDCDLQILNPTNMSMGSESQLSVLDNELFLYQRSASWWPYTLIYRLNMRYTGKYLKPKSIIPMVIKSNTRPGYEGCNHERVCPKVCVTGVFQAPWILSIGRDHKERVSNVTYMVAWSMDKSDRTYPAVSVCGSDTCKLTVPLGDSKVHSAYSVTRCYLSRDHMSAYCLVIFELDARPWAEMRIQSFLYKLILT